MVGAAGFEEPEQPLDSHVHDLVRGLFNSRKVHHVGDAFHGGRGGLAICD
jgi:hypothetical protein